MGITWVHDNVTDLSFSAIGGPIHGLVNTDITDFFNGGGPDTSIDQAFPSSNEQGIKFNTLGGYVAGNDWKVNDRLKPVSMNLRMEHYANPTCEADCFSRLSSTFNGAGDPNAVSTPYNQFIVSGTARCLPEYQRRGLGTAGWDCLAAVP